MPVRPRALLVFALQLAVLALPPALVQAQAAAAGSGAGSGASNGASQSAGKGAGSAQAGEPSATQERGTGWRNTLGSAADTESPPTRRTMSAEERNHLRQHMRDATREGYPDATASGRPAR